MSPVPEVMPTPIAVALTFARHSLAFGRAHAELQRLWSEFHDHPEVRLKRDMMDWFAGREDFPPPDERTVRRKVSAIWKELRPARLEAVTHHDCWNGIEPFTSVV